ncbi:MAG TPA: DUF1326 domain-containing protein [Candidatus Dormibacteraeota bacterium]
MAVAQSATAVKKGGYLLEGTLLEACSCGVLCPCWVGENPDLGECFAAIAWHYDKGRIGNVDVSGLTAVSITHIPGNILTPKSWRAVLFIDAKATDEQKNAIVGAIAGEYGGPLADLFQLVGKVEAVKTAPIRHDVEDGHGVLEIPGVLEAEMDPYRNSDGRMTTLRDSIFSTVPGSPAYVSKQSRYRVNLPEFGMVWEYKNSNAVQADYRMEFKG